MKDLTQNISNIEAVFSRFIAQIEAVPFGNSDYQNRQAIVNGEMTPMRAYRHAALRITNRLNALMESHYHLRRVNIELQQLAQKITPDMNALDRELVEIDIEQKRATLPYIQKLIADAIGEIESLYPIIEKMGTVTRKQFELEEHEHFLLKAGETAGALPPADLFERITGKQLEAQFLLDQQ